MGYMPARLTNRLTELEAKGAAPGLHPDGDGLYLHVGANGSKSWVFRYRFGGRRRDMGLGRYPLFSIKDARDEANKHRRLLYDRIDPIATRKAEREAKRGEKAEPAATFGQVVLGGYKRDAGVIAAKRVRWTAKHEHDFLHSLQTHAARLWPMAVTGIDADTVADLLRPIWSTKPVIAKCVRQRIEAVLDYATVMKYRSGDNPARWAGNLEHLLAADAKGAKSHHEALPYAEIAGFMASIEDTPVGKALAFTILTAARSSEVRKATWQEIDLQARVWTVPAERMKARREHKVPLSGAAAAILAALPHEGELVFPVGERSLYQAVQRLRPDATLHGFRSTFRDWAYEKTDFPREIAEHCLAHIEGSGSELAYKRGDAIEKRRAVMDAWAAHCA
jgi:integrase